MITFSRIVLPHSLKSLRDKIFLLYYLFYSIFYSLRGLFHAFDLWKVANRNEIYGFTKWCFIQHVNLRLQDRHKILFSYSQKEIASVVWLSLIKIDGRYVKNFLGWLAKSWLRYFSHSVGECLILLTEQAERKVIREMVF